jgi:hypothetical protein
MNNDLLVKKEKDCGRSFDIRSSGGTNLKPLAQLGGIFLVTPKAKRPDVGQIAFAAPFGDRKNVVGIPETSALGVQIQLTV